MNIAILLKPEAVRVLGAMSSKKRLFHELGEIVQLAHHVPSELAIDALRERESLGPTGVGLGVALPHARVDGIDTVKGVFLRIERPMEYDAVDRRPVDLIFSLFAPKSKGVDHLKALAAVSRTLRDPDLCARLRVNTDPRAIHAILTSEVIDRVS